MKKILIFGVTGSIGQSTVSIIREFPTLFKITGLTAHTNQKKLLELSREFHCENTVLTASQTFNKNQLKTLVEKSQADIAVNGIAGSAGLLPSILCLEAGIDLALANKETIVMAGYIIRNLAKKNSAKIIPVDSEHSALFALINAFNKKNIDRLLITASGGPFRNTPSADFKNITKTMALKHPTWNMGAKISIDSATLANKGLEVIEAARLFDITPKNIQIAIHPQSLVHSLVRTIDGDIYAQISPPDMRHPILSALSGKDMHKNSLKKISFWSPFSPIFDNQPLNLEFLPPRFNDFPLLKMAYEVQNKGDAYTIAYNAANEVAVSLFLSEKISFISIWQLVEKVLQSDWHKKVVTIDDVFLFDSMTRKIANEYAKGMLL